MLRPVLFFIIGVSVFTIGYVFAYNYLDSVQVNISSKNITSLTVLEPDSSEVIFKSGSEPTSSFRVPKYSTVLIHYNGKENYETNTTTVKMADKSKDININPYYSDEYLATLVSGELSSINQTINNYDHTIEEGYSINNVKLYHFGEWASATLTWKGDYGQNTDTQRVILNKKNNTWAITTEPSILFFYKNYPDIPLDILEKVNNPS